jgi:hypothetical protein
MMRSAAAPILERGDQDPLVQFRRGAWRRQRAEQAQDASAPADLGGTRCAALDVARQTRRIRRFELIEQERVDQGAGARTIQGAANVRVRHITYMTRLVQKVARRAGSGRPEAVVLWRDAARPDSRPLRAAHPLRGR